MPAALDRNREVVPGLVKVPSLAAHDREGVRCTISEKLVCGLHDDGTTLRAMRINRRASDAEAIGDHRLPECSGKEPRGIDRRPAIFR